MYYLLLIIALVLNASGNIFMKIGATKFQELQTFNPPQLFVKLLTNHFLILGIILFALNVVFYIFALTKINLSIAYPIMTSGGFLIISLFSVIYLKEELTPLQIMGIILVVLGITLIAYHFK